MQYIVCYDIADDRRRERLSTVLLNYGQRVRESVFVANLDGEPAERISDDAKKTLDVDQDRVHIFRLCVASAGSTEVIGIAEVVEDRAWYVV